MTTEIGYTGILPYYGVQTPVQNSLGLEDKIREYLGLKGHYLNNDAQLKMFSRMFGYKDVGSFIRDANNYSNIDSFVADHAGDISISFNALLKTAPDQIKDLAEALKSADNNYEELTHNPVAAKDNPRIAADHANASLDRLEKTVRLRADLQKALETAAKDSPEYKEIAELIKKCDGQIQKEVAFLNKLAKDNPGVLNIVSGRGIKLSSRSPEVDYCDTLSVMSEDEEKKDSVDFAPFLFQYKSPFEYWLSEDYMKQAASETEMMQAVMKKNETARKEFAKFLDKNDIEAIVTNPFPGPYDDMRLAAILAQRGVQI